MSEKDLYFKNKYDCRNSNLFYNNYVYPFVPICDNLSCSHENDIQSNLLMQSPLLSSHLYPKVKFFLSCHRTSHMN